MLVSIMSEMLANQYFLVRRYKDAETAFEKVLESNPLNKSVRKKLIICYVHNGQISKALDKFYHLIKEDIYYIIHTDLIADDCPCPELIEIFEKSGSSNYSSINVLEIYGILWLYCDMEKSLNYFEQLKQLNPSEKIYSDILEIYYQYTVNHK